MHEFSPAKRCDLNGLESCPKMKSRSKARINYFYLKYHLKRSYGAVIDEFCLKSCRIIRSMRNLVCINSYEVLII